MSLEPPCRPSAMEIDVTPVGQIADGALGDDERTETERSPVENKSPPRRGAETATAAEDPRAGEEESGESGTGERAEESGAGEAANGRNNRRKHRRGKNKAGRRHNRSWKPYNKLSWEERQALDERETRRATIKREKQFAAGQPMAPYNTTQFLMEQHQPLQATFPRKSSPPSSHPGEGSGSFGDSSEEYYDSPEGEDCMGKDVFLEKEFTETYENCHAERLQQLTKDELVREYLDLEGRVDRLERRLRQVAGDAAAHHHTEEGQGAPARERALVNGTAAPGSLPSEQSEDITQIKNLEEQIRQLKQDNEKLRLENDKIQTSKPAEVPEIVGES